MKNPDLVSELNRAILDDNPGHRIFLETSTRGIAEADWLELNQYLVYCQSRGMDIPYLAECYNVIVNDTLVEQIFFRRHGRYRHASYEDVANSVYHDPVYMEKYMVGLAITLFFWPAHRELKRFFNETLPADMRGTYLEVGPGHGFNFMTAIRETRFDLYLAVDISETSLKLTREILENRSFRTSANVQLMQADFLDFAHPEPISALVMGEVLEHVEQPGLFLAQARNLTRPESYIYLSTCANAPAVDHLSLFTSFDHLKTIIGDAGLRVVDHVLIPYQGLSVEETTERRLPLNMGAVLSHA